MTSSQKKQTWEDAVQWLKAQPDQQGLVKDAFFDDPLIDAAQRYKDSTEWAAIRELLPKQIGRVLDVGAGRGIASYALANDGWEVTALEPDTSSVVGSGAIRQLFEQSDMSVEIAETWGESLPFADNSFDLLHCRQVLHHARDLEQLCCELARVLKPGGLMIATREHVISRLDDLEVFLESHPLHKLYGGEHAYLLSRYKDAIKSAGFELKKVFNPYESDINLYPITMKDVKSSIAGKLHVSSLLIPDLLLSFYGNTIDTPGRLYSFVARKPV